MDSTLLIFDQFDQLRAIFTIFCGCLMLQTLIHEKIYRMRPFECKKNHEKSDILKKTVQAYIAPEDFDDFWEKLET